MKRILLTSLLLSTTCFASFDYSHPAHDEENFPEDEYCLDLEAGQQPFVLEIRKIEIDGHPHAFNPSIIRWRGEILLAFRTYLTPRSSYEIEIGLIRLDEEFSPIGKASFLRFPDRDPSCLSKRQDPRLVESNGRLWVVYNNVLDLREINPKLEIRRMLFAEVECDDTGFTAKEPECLYYFDEMKPQRSEKNWVPFDFDGNLLFSYSLFPHRIMEPLFGTNSCRTVFSHNSPIEWDWGVLRGGTPAIEVDGKYLAFFHSSTNIASCHSEGILRLHYFMGAFTFSKEPPFAIERMSPEPITAHGFYEGKKYKTWKPLHVVFPGGFLVDGPFIWLVYGRQDHEVWITKLDKQGLLDSLESVSAM